MGFEPRNQHGPKLLTVALAVSMLLTGSQVARAQQDGRQDAVAAIRQRGKLVMLSFPHQKSIFVRTDVAKGAMPKFGTADRFSGIDVDLMMALAGSLGVELWIRPVSEPSFGALIPDLLAGKGDLIASSFTITEQRREQVVFSEPYYAVYPVIVARKGTTIESPADLTDKVASTIPGSSHEEHLRRLGVPAARLFRVSFVFEDYTAVLDGDADFTLVDSSSAERVLPKLKELEIAFRLPGEDHYGFAVPPGSNLIAYLNRFVAEMKRSGRLQEIIHRHLP